MALVSARCFPCSIRQHPLARSGPYGYKIADFIMLALLVLLPLPVSGALWKNYAPLVLSSEVSRLVFFPLWSTFSSLWLASFKGRNYFSFLSPHRTAVLLTSGWFITFSAVHNLNPLRWLARAHSQELAKDANNSFHGASWPRFFYPRLCPSVFDKFFDCEQ